MGGKVIERIEVKDSLFDEALNAIKENKRVRDTGGVIAIPWKNLPGLTKVVPGIQKAKYNLITASSKAGKTQLANYLYLFEPYEYIKTYKPNNIRLKIKYFSLEVNKIRIMMSILSYKLFKDRGILRSPDELLSVYEDRVIDNTILSYIEEYRPYFEEFEKDVEIIDNIRNGYGIFKYMQQYAESNGKWSYKDIEWVTDNGDIEIRRVKDTYIENDPGLITIVIIDNYNVLLPEKGQTLFDAIHKFSSDYCLYLRDKYKFTIVGVQQQGMDTEKHEFTFSGNTVVDKLRPSASGLGDCRLTARDCNLMIGIFAPFRHKIPSYEGYDITRLGDHYRELMVILNRDGSGFCSDHLLFHGGVNFFKELPNSAAMTTDYYKLIDEKLGR